MIWLKNPLARFLITGGLLFLAWQFLYDLVLIPDERLDQFVIKFTLIPSQWMLDILGYDTYLNEDNLGIEDNGIRMGRECNGVPLFALFSIFIIAFPGSWKRKFLFIPIGIICVHILNINRVISLTLIFHHNPAYLDFNHNYTFTIIIYGFIFLLWMYWVKMNLGFVKAKYT